MIGLAAYHGAERDQGVKIVGQCHGLQHQRNLQRTRHRDHRDVALVYAVLTQGRSATRQQTIADVLIKAAHNNADVQACALVMGFDVCHLNG